MIKIDYPTFQPAIKIIREKEFIFDGHRKQWVQLTPEEWVRQNFLAYLVKVKYYPAPLIAVEKEIKLGELVKRFDIVVYNRQSMPWMIIECKEMKVALAPSVLHQALRYNISLAVPYIVITNGNHCHGFCVNNNQLEEMDQLPAFNTDTNE